MEQLFQHFREEERIFLEKVLGWKQQVEETYSHKLTDFLDPREQDMVEAVIGTNQEVKVMFFGGHPNVERKRAILHPDYFHPETGDFEVSLYKIQYPEKFISIEHRQVLGSLLSLGLNRSKFGDILFHENQVQLAAAMEYDPFLLMNFQEIGRAKVSLIPIDFSEIIEPKEEIQEMSSTVSSLRLDAVAAAIYNLSRQKVQSLIHAGAVKVNFRAVEQTSFECREGDILSIRGYGRSKLVSIEGKTKKEKIRIIAGRQK